MNRIWPEYAPLPLRLILGSSFLYHGITKFTGGIENTAGFFGDVGIPAPGLMAWVAALIEIVGGLMLLAGAFVGIVGALLIIEMLVAMFTVHLPSGFDFMNQPPGVEVSLLFIAGLLALILGGAGAFSVDEARKRRTPATTARKPAATSDVLPPPEATPPPA